MSEVEENIGITTGNTLPVVDNFCYCISLRTGTITFAVLSCVGSFTTVIVSGVGLIVGDQFAKTFNMSPEALKKSCIFLLVTFLICSLLAIFVTWGAIHKKTGVLKSWCVHLWVIFVVNSIILLINPFESSWTSAVRIRKLVSYLINGVFTAYKLLVIHSYRQQILLQDEYDTSI